MKRLSILLLGITMTGVAYAQNLTEPRVTNLQEIITQIEYPLEARSQAIEGNVKIEVTVSNSGKVESFTVKNACDPLLKEAIEQVANKLEFIPAFNHKGETIKSTISIPFKFRLDIS